MVKKKCKHTNYNSMCYRRIHDPNLHILTLKYDICEGAYINTKVPRLNFYVTILWLKIVI